MQLSEYIICSMLQFVMLMLVVIPVTFISNYFAPVFTKKTLLIIVGYVIVCGCFFSIRDSLLLDGRDTTEYMRNFSYVTFMIVFISMVVCAIWFADNLKFISILAIIFISTYCIYKTTPIFFKNAGAHKLCIKENFFISKNNPNVFVMSLDALQANIIEELLKRRPDFKKSLSGFTFYPNTTTLAPFTKPSLAFLQLGYAPYKSLKNRSFREFYKSIYEKKSSFITTALENNNYHISFFGSFKHSRPAHQNIGLCNDDYREDHSYQAFSASLYRYIPFSFNAVINYFNSGGAYLQLGAHSHTKQFLLKNSNDPSRSAYLKKKILKLNSYVSSISSEKYKSTAHFHHYGFTHGPLALDSTCSYHFISSVIQNKESLLAEAECGFTKLIEFINKLKSLDVYDNSLIFLISDHGSMGRFFANEFSTDDYYLGGRWTLSRYSPLLMVKAINSSAEPLREDMFQASLLDIASTICNNLLDEKVCRKYTGVNLLDEQEKLNAISAPRYTLISNKYTNANRIIKEYEDFYLVDIGRKKSISEHLQINNPQEKIFHISKCHVRIGKRIKGHVKVDRSTKGKGLFVYSPDRDLKQGKYRVEIVYRSLSPKDVVVGSWNAYAKKKGAKTGATLFEKKLYGTSNKWVSEESSIHIQDDVEDFRINTFFSGVDDLSIKEMKIIILNKL